MVNKILTLFDMEFRRIQKIFFSVLVILILGNVGLFTYEINSNINTIATNLGMIEGSLSVFDSDSGIVMFKNLGTPQFIYSLSYIMMAFALLWCLYYSIRIWSREFSDKTKSIYTLFMLPENRFIIFISKLLTMVVLIYGVILVQHLCWIGEGLFIKKYTNISFLEMINTINYMNASISIITVPPIYPMEFFMYYMLGPIVGIIVLFTAVLISKAIKKVGGLLGLVYVISLIMVYLSITVLNMTYSDKLLFIHIGFYLIASIVSSIVSYNLLNKKIAD